MKKKDMWIKEYLSEIGTRGGKKSRRKLTRAQSLAMLKARAAAYAAGKKRQNKPKK